MSRKRYGSEAERQKAYRARKKFVPLAVDVPVEVRVALAAEDEKAIRERFGFSGSEPRSQAERRAAAERIIMAGRESLVAAKRIWELQARDDVRRTEIQLEALRLAEARMGRKIPATGPDDRAKRAEAYRVWRNEAYLRGECATPADMELFDGDRSRRG